MAAAGKASLGLHAALREARQRNGLKHADYGRYRQYSTRRPRRLRKALKFSNGKGKYVGRELTPDLPTAEEPRFLLLPLLQSERAWGHAMQIKQDGAARAAGELEALCTTCADAKTELEALCTTC